MTLAFRVSAVLILFCALLIATYPVWAKDLPAGRQDSTSTGTTRREAAKERITSLKERLASKEAALKARLEQFKDKRKAEVTQKISNTLNRINEKHTQMMLKFLDRASVILGKLEERVIMGKPDIKDVEAAKIAIAVTKEAIASASATVNAQAEKDYTITITSESRVKTDAQTKRKQLHDDLQAVRKLVIHAKQAVANAIRVAKSGKVEIPGKEATESGQ